MSKPSKKIEKSGGSLNTSVLKTEAVFFSETSGCPRTILRYNPGENYLHAGRVYRQPSCLRIDRRVKYDK
jgi:hypothetical protein